MIAEEGVASPRSRGGFYGEQPEKSWSRGGADGWDGETAFDIQLWNILCADQEESAAI